MRNDGSSNRAGTAGCSASCETRNTMHNQSAVLVQLSIPGIQEALGSCLEYSEAC